MKRTYLFFFLYCTLITILPQVSKAQSIGNAKDNLDVSMQSHYKIYDVVNKKLIQLDDLVNSLKPMDVIFFGEEHNDSTAHHLQFEVFKKLGQIQGAAYALSLEMFHTDVQPIMDEYLKGIISEKNFIKETRAWNNYKDYKPLIEHAKLNQLPVIAANAATRYTNAVTRSGLESLANLPSSSKNYLAPLPIDTLTGPYYEKFTALLGGHMGSMKVYQSQNLWDATMAWSMANFKKKYKKYKILHLNGRFHSDEKLGTYAQLKKYAPKLKTTNIACFSADDFQQPNWEKYTHLGDYVILTDPQVKRSY